MADLILYGLPMSPFARKVEVVLKEKNLDYDYENVNIMPMPEWFAEISPARRIPVLRDCTVGKEGRPGTIADSSAICAYLERRVPTDLYGKSAFDCGHATWLEEYADTELGATIGMGVFRPLFFPRIQKKESDIETAKETWNEKLPGYFDYLESELDGATYFVGDALSIADIAISCQMAQLDMVAGSPDKKRWPTLVAHLENMKAHPGLQHNLSVCNKILSRFFPEKVDLG